MDIRQRLGAIKSAYNEMVAHNKTRFAPVRHDIPEADLGFLIEQADRLQQIEQALGDLREAALVYRENSGYNGRCEQCGMSKGYHRAVCSYLSSEKALLEQILIANALLRKDGEA